ncbi:glutamate 5-kinase [Alteriqipengyuania lutimaris]|uniref:Glutamate 5-kinase n=1 Tax=Alteriqipengyuania lutimaris TaxID=1538146 RepID=A0A395LHX4_9SPHN|nr:glutamate 5-kinase [Alteriqipengyuania lutimaris]MBB3034905.1 glutamate 5-kinase [Alteriqipengyuania lutimaris]RDS76265.1 glutamate 5-kinase [Alteriqipengyuania lutimaris]
MSERPAAPDAAQLIGAARTMIMKVGSSLLVDRERRQVRAAWLAALAEDVAALRETGKQVIVVSSGAVALGWHHLGIERPTTLDRKQAVAAIGQSLVMNAWRAAFEPHHVAVAQLLLTRDDTGSDRRRENARATLAMLLEMGALPIINENDSVATEELQYGDNDQLSALVAELAGADALLLLSDVDGLYDGDPAQPDARHIGHVPQVTAEIEALARQPLEGSVGTGGMASKLTAARLAGERGCGTILASGRPMHALARLQEGKERSTVIGVSCDNADAKASR